jgi:CelD/BcsL family acetyltransferase involved in cellulose biosynthesis
MTGTGFVPLVVTRGGADIGVAPLLVRRRGLLSIVNWVPFPYVGPLVPRDVLASTLDALDRWAVRHGVIRQQQSFPPGTDVDERALVDRGFAVDHDSTYVVPVRPSSEQQWAGLDTRCRNAIRKAQRLGARVQEAPDTTALGEIVEAVFARRGHGSGYRDGFPPSIHRLHQIAPRVRATVALHDGTAVGSLVSLEHRGRALVWLGGVRPEFRSTNANTLLYWDAIEWARDLGAAEVDLVGLPDAGIARFKQQFGGALRSYTVGQRTAAAARMFQAGRALL